MGPSGVSSAVTIGGADERCGFFRAEDAKNAAEGLGQAGIGSGSTGISRWDDPGINWDEVGMNRDGGEFSG
jgi:hypothetical protein